MWKGGGGRSESVADKTTPALSPCRAHRHHHTTHLDKKKNDNINNNV